MIAIPPDWKAEALAEVRKMRGEFQMEIVRQRLAARSIFAPKPNNWGGFTTDLLAAEVIERTGEWRVTKDKKTHSRTAVYRVKR